MPIQPVKTTVTQKELSPLNVHSWKEFILNDLFDVFVSKDNNFFNCDIGAVPYIASSSENNGVTGMVDSLPSQISNTLKIARNGSVGSTFYQPKEYCASPDDIRFLTQFDRKDEE